VVTNEFGCKDTASQIIKVKPSWIVYIPNTFTPNGDGLNDGFTAKGYNINKFNIQIYDRWGHLLFESNDMENQWDGHTKNSDEPIKQDVYVWKVQVVDIFNKNHDLTGHVTLLKNDE
jgi:gliding motility-associated-like protein